MREQEGFIPVLGEYRVWYRIVGGGAEQETVPILTVHGGPGIPHDYITDMAALASESRHVIFGGSRSGACSPWNMRFRSQRGW
jgi:hypothetical protein